MPSFGEISLSFAADLYGAVTGARNFLYDRGILRSYRCRMPVISVGNLTCGGNGKTPLVIELVKHLRAAGRNPAVLSRGYRGRTPGPHLVAAGDTPADVGDEPLLIAAETGAPMVVARRRAAGARFIERKLKCDCIVLDDGFQHRALKRDLEIVCVDVGSERAREAFRRAELLPLGRFRESRDRALRRSDAVVFSERRIIDPLPPLEERITRVIPEGVRVFRSAMRSAGVTGVETGDALAPCQVAAFCALANPDAFFASLCTLGFTVVAEARFSDHHQFTDMELRELRAASRGAPLVCSEKDAVKLKDLDRQGIYQLKTQTVVTPHAEFLEMLAVHSLLSVKTPLSEHRSAKS